MYAIRADANRVVVARDPWRQGLALKTVRMQRMRPTDRYLAIVTTRLPPSFNGQPFARTSIEWRQTNEGLVLSLPAECFVGKKDQTRNDGRRQGRAEAHVHVMT